MSKVLGKRRRRPEDHDELEEWAQAGIYPAFCVMPVLVPRRMRDEVNFMVGKRVCGEPVTRAVVAITSMELTRAWTSAQLRAEVELHTATGWYTDLHAEAHDCREDLLRILECIPLCRAFLMGMLPNMGRNEHKWIEVDEDTRKRVRSPPDSSVHRAFVKHTLSERRLVREIFSFLCQ